MPKGGMILLLYKRQSHLRMKRTIKILRSKIPKLQDQRIACLCLPKVMRMK